jgi:hypothetical protein
VRYDGGMISEEGRCDLDVRVTDLARPGRRTHNAEISMDKKTLVMDKVLTFNIRSSI